METPMTYANNTGADVRDYESAIFDAIKAGGCFNDALADIFKLTKTPPGSAVDWILDFI